MFLCMCIEKLFKVLAHEFTEIVFDLCFFLDKRELLENVLL